MSKESDNRDITMMLLRSNTFWMQVRIDSLLDRAGSVKTAMTGPGIGIGYLFAKDIVRAMEQAAEIIEPTTRFRRWRGLARMCSIFLICAGVAHYLSQFPWWVSFPGMLMAAAGTQFAWTGTIRP